MWAHSCWALWAFGHISKRGAVLYIASFCFFFEGFGSFFFAAPTTTSGSPAGCWSFFFVLATEGSSAGCWSFFFGLATAASAGCCGFFFFFELDEEGRRPPRPSSSSSQDRTPQQRDFENDPLNGVQGVGFRVCGSRILRA